MLGSHLPHGALARDEQEGDHGVPFTFWASTGRIRQKALLFSGGTIGDGDDTVMRESFRSFLQSGLHMRWSGW